MAFDPLGRLAAHAAKPYPEEHKTEADIARWWSALYREEARRLGVADLEREAITSAAAVGVCEAELKATETRRHVLGRLPAPWDREQERCAAAIDLENLRHRLVRLTARKEVLRIMLDQRLVVAHVERTDMRSENAR